MPEGSMPLDRRSILKGISAVGATTLAAAGAQAQPAPTAPAPAAAAPAAPPAHARDWTPASGSPDPGPQVQANSGSDFMIDVFKSLGFEYMAANPGTSWRGFHESLINYGGNVCP